MRFELNHGDTEGTEKDLLRASRPPACNFSVFSVPLWLNKNALS